MSRGAARDRKDEIKKQKEPQLTLNFDTLMAELASPVEPAGTAHLGAKPDVPFVMAGMQVAKDSDKEVSGISAEYEDVLEADPKHNINQDDSLEDLSPV